MNSTNEYVSGLSTRRQFLIQAGYWAIGLTLSIEIFKVFSGSNVAYNIGKVLGKPLGIILCIYTYLLAATIFYRLTETDHHLFGLPKKQLFKALNLRVLPWYATITAFEIVYTVFVYGVHKI